MVPLDVLWSDAEAVVVRKPAGMPSQPDPTGDADVLSLLRVQLNDPAIALIHRLDRPVSGVMIFGRTPYATATLNDQFQHRRIEKVYWALVEGTFTGVRSVAHILAHDARARKARVGIGVEGKLARMDVRCMVPGDRYTMVEVRIAGGAFHQIRALLGAEGTPIKGDVKYGARRGEKDRSIFLHARSITFHHPRTNTPVTVEAEVPELPLWSIFVAKLTAA